MYVYASAVTQGEGALVDPAGKYFTVALDKSETGYDLRHSSSLGYGGTFTDCKF